MTAVKLSNQKQSTLFHGLRLLARCGSGAFGEVYLCQDISGRKMAVKIVPKSMLGNAWKRELNGVINYRKITEDAPFLLEIYHVEEDEDCLFYTMEPADSISADQYVPDTLTERLKQGPLAQEEIFPVLCGIFSGIESIHAAGLAHRDIKPENILFADGLAKIGDIGLLAADGRTSISLAGTPDFLPPETKLSDYTESHPEHYFQKNDFYAFGKLIYCTVTGKDPHSFPSIPQTMELTQTVKEYLQLAFRLCDHSPKNRLQDLSQIQKELFRIEKKLQFGESCKEQFLRYLQGIPERIKRNLSFPGKPMKGQQIQEYVHPKFGISMEIPAEWSILTMESIQEHLKRKTAHTAQEEEQIHLLRSISASGPCLIYCDYDHAFPDNCFVERLQMKASDFEGIPDDLLHFQVCEMLKSDMGDQTEIYAVRRTAAGQIPAIRAEASLNPKQSRSVFYFILFPDHCISIVLNAKISSYAKRVGEFEKAIKTLRFSEKILLLL